jgi:lipoyl-dependent peroxiredoxin
MTITKIDTILLTGKTRTTASVRGGDRLDIALSVPGSSAGGLALDGAQMHPTAEQLFAGAWSACYTGALGLVAQARNVKLPADMAVDIEVDLGKTGAAYFIQARIAVSMPGVAHDVAEAIAHAAHGVCPYSKAVHGNIGVVTTVAGTEAVAA